MRILVSILLTALLTFAFGLYLPWWSAALAPFVVALLIIQRPFHSFVSGFCGLLLLWLVLILVIDSANNGIMSRKVSMLLGLGPSPTVLIIINCVIGALVGGMGALTGSLLIKLKR
ncbi:MAG: hypothetical protein JNK79_00985 [Chitinophagaceae bacterium]|nr:hypothetical protein [Chitinophagaceae bacterium]